MQHEDDYIDAMAEADGEAEAEGRAREAEMQAGIEAEKYSQINMEAQADADAAEEKILPVDWVCKNYHAGNTRYRNTCRKCGNHAGIIDNIRMNVLYGRPLSIHRSK